MQLHVGQRIRIVVNGEATETGAATLAELVAALGYNEGQVATARNGDFVPRGARAEHEARSRRQHRDRGAAPGWLAVGVIPVLGSPGSSVPLAPECKDGGYRGQAPV